MENQEEFLIKVLGFCLLDFTRFQNHTDFKIDHYELLKLKKLLELKQEFNKGINELFK